MHFTPGSCRSVALALAPWLAWCVAIRSSAAAPSSRAETIAEQQEWKAEHLGIEGPSKLENTVVWVQSSPLFPPASGVYPWAGSVYPGTGLSLGVGYVRRWPPKTHLNLVASAAVKGSWLFKADARLPEIASGLLTVTLDARHMFAKDLSFFGLGLDSPHSNPLRYDYRTTTLGLTAALHPVPWLALIGGYARLNLQTKSPSPVPPAGNPALGDKLAYNVVQAGMALDWRASPGYSTLGGLQRLTWSLYLETRDLPFACHQLEYEGIQLVPILRAQYVLAFHVLTTLTTTQAGDEVPVVLSPTLGDAETLRGFDERRFTDRNRLLLTAEYRWRPSRYLDMAIFYDAGKVGPRREDLGLSNLETDWGIGARIHSPKSVLIRVEVAKSREGWQTIFAGGKAF